MGRRANVGSEHGVVGRGARRSMQVGLCLLSTASSLRRALDDEMARCGGSLAQWNLLKVLERQGELTQARLADELGLAARSITQSVAAMERSGLVRRAADDTDGRAKIVSMTAAGRRALSACDAEMVTFMDRALGNLDAGQMETFNDFLLLVARTPAGA